MTGRDRATASGCGRPRLLRVVVDNGAYGTTRMHQEPESPGRVSCSALSDSGFALLAHACGWRAERVVRTGQSEPAFERLPVAARPGLPHLVLDADLSAPRSAPTPGPPPGRVEELGSGPSFLERRSRTTRAAICAARAAALRRRRAGR